MDIVVVVAPVHAVHVVVVGKIRLLKGGGNIVLRQESQRSTAVLWILVVVVAVVQEIVHPAR